MHIKRSVFFFFYEDKVIKQGIIDRAIPILSATDHHVKSTCQPIVASYIFRCDALEKKTI